MDHLVLVNVIYYKASAAEGHVVQSGQWSAMWSVASIAVDVDMSICMRLEACLRASVKSQKNGKKLRRTTKFTEYIQQELSIDNVECFGKGRRKQGRCLGVADDIFLASCRLCSLCCFHSEIRTMRRAIVTPVYKSGAAYDVSNYRPISLSE